MLDLLVICWCVFLHSPHYFKWQLKSNYFNECVVSDICCQLNNSAFAQNDIGKMNILFLGHLKYIHLRPKPIECHVSSGKQFISLQFKWWRVEKNINLFGNSILLNREKEREGKRERARKREGLECFWQPSWLTHWLWTIPVRKWLEIVQSYMPFAQQFDQNPSYIIYDIFHLVRS